MFDAFNRVSKNSSLDGQFYYRTVLSDFVPSPCRAPRRDSLVVFPGLGFESCCSRTCIACKGFTETNRRRYTGQQPATKSARGPDSKARINRWSTESFVPSAVEIGFALCVRARIRSEQWLTMRRIAREAVGFQGDRNVGILFCPASTRPAVRPAPC